MVFMLFAFLPHFPVRCTFIRFQFYNCVSPCLRGCKSGKCNSFFSLSLLYLYYTYLPFFIFSFSLWSTFALSTLSCSFVCHISFTEPHLSLRTASQFCLFVVNFISVCSHFASTLIQAMDILLQANMTHTTRIVHSMHSITLQNNSVKIPCIFTMRCSSTRYMYSNVTCSSIFQTYRL